MWSLTVLYDARCSLCCRIRAWLQSQPQFVQLDFIAAHSDEAQTRYPALDHALTLKVLHVVSSDGEVYRDAKAWLMCLWALREYRPWALRLASPTMLPFARRVVARVASQRYRFIS